MPIWMTLTFLSVVGLISSGIHLYVLSRVDASLASSLSDSPLALGGLVLLSLCYFVIGRWLTPRRAWVRLLGWCSGLWLGALVYLLLWGACAQLLTWALADAVSPPYWWLIGALLTIAYGLWSGTRPPVIKRVELTIPRLAHELDGLKIAQLSDIHIGPTLGERFAAELARRTAALSPDLIVITGDLVDGSVERLREDVEPLITMSAPLGLYFVTGNHELISAADPWVSYLMERGVRVLENEGLQLKRQGATLNIAGVEDWEGSRFPPPRPPSLSEALEGLDPEAPTILLAHQPKAAREAAERGVALQLSGHTHGGQMFPFSWLIYLDQPYRSGLYDVEGMKLYVSEGTGYWGPPLRVGTRSELTLITLRSPS